MRIFLLTFNLNISYSIYYGAQKWNFFNNFTGILNGNMEIRNILFNLVFVLFGYISLQAQNISLVELQQSSKSPLNQVFYDYKLVKIDFDQLKASMASRGNQHFITLKHPDFVWNLELFDHEVYTSDYLLRVGTDHGVQEFRRHPDIHSLIGYLKSSRGGEVRMTIADNFIAGMIKDGGATFFIEQANGIDPAYSNDVLVIYDSEKIFQNPSIECGFEKYIKNKQQVIDQSEEKVNNSRNHCVQVEIAIANDFPVFQKRGSVANVENWNNTILTLLQDNYDNEFAHSIEFVQSASFVASSAASDPWNGINNINTHLDKHVSWGNGGGYGAGYDVATAWTTKYTNGAVGLAWLGVICNNLRYNVCSDYGGSNNCVRQLQAHELGHNFNADHDGNGAPFIMAPAVNCLSAWSSNSITRINAHVSSRGCLSICSGGSAPVADFYGNPVSGCVPFSVNFFDLSTNDPNSWLWSFPGGTPSSSTQQNPVVTYKTFGNFDVTLRVSNAFGSNTVTFSKYIEANDKPKANFSKVIVSRTVYFTNLTLYGNTYEWDFGDGETSTDSDPIHEYQNDGVYDVILRAENDCGVNEFKMKVTIITVPIALFSADTTFGCTTFKVKFINLSSTNVTSWTWTFPGGTPSTSSLFEPTVEYKNPGSFDVKLVARNSKYTATSEKLNYIKADSVPIASFIYQQNGTIVSFSDHSKFSKTLVWEFGDGKNSNEQNPTHEYLPGVYQAKQIVENPCGKDTFVQELIIGSGLIAGFTSDFQKGCIPFEVNFKNTSFGASSYLWSFPGGSPSSSTDKDPVVIYNTVGIFDVTLKVKGNGDSVTISKQQFVNVGDNPEAAFQKSITGFSVFFNDQSKLGANYFWDFGDTKTSTEVSPTHVYSAEGDYQVRLIVSNDCGSDTLNQLVAVYLVPKIDFTADTTVICGFGEVQFTSKTSADVNSWSWVFDGATPDNSSDKNPLVYYDKKGTYSVKLTVRNSNGENTLIRQTYIKVISPVLCPDYIFHKNSELNGEIIFPVKKQEIDGIQVYPNPFNGLLNISGLLVHEKNFIRIYNYLGAEVYSEVSLSDKSNIQLNLNELNAGSYILSIENKKNTYTKAIFLSR